KEYVHRRRGRDQAKVHAHRGSIPRRTATCGAWFLPVWGINVRSSTSRTRRSVLALDDEVRATDRAGELGPLANELEPVGTLLRDLHPVRELEADGSLPGVLERVEHVDGQARLVEHVGPADALDLEGRRLQRRGADDDVPLLPEDAVHIGD